MSVNKIIDYDEILFMIRNNLIEVMEDDYEYYKNYDVVIAKEQEFIKTKDIDPNKIYIVVSFGSTDVYYGQMALSVVLKVMSEENKLDTAQNLLMSFAVKYNLTWDDDKMIYQVWQSPTINSNFNVVHTGFRSILTTSGMLMIAKNANPSHLEFQYTDGVFKEIPSITFSEGFTNQLDTQPYFNSSNFAKSRAKFGTLTFTITMYLTNDELITRALKIAYRKISNDTIFRIKVAHLQDDDLTFEDDFRLLDLSSERVLGEFQMIALTFML